MLAITCNVSWSSCFRGSLRDPNEVSRVEGVVLGEKGHLLDQKYKQLKDMGSDRTSFLLMEFIYFLFFILNLKKTGIMFIITGITFKLFIYFISYNFNAFLGMA